MTPHYDRDLLSDYVHGALEPENDARIFAHLATCADCAALHREEVALGEALRGVAAASEREFPSLIRARVWDAVRRERPTFAQRVLAGWVPRIAVPAVAAVALFAYFGVPATHQGPAPAGVSAAYYLDEHNATVQQNPLGPGISPAAYGSDAQAAASTAASYIDTADAATLDDADGAVL